MKKNKVIKQEECEYDKVSEKVKLIFYCYKRDIDYCTESCENKCVNCYAGNGK